MNSSQSVLVGMSGGVDSTVTALKLKNAGYKVKGVHLGLWKWHDDPHAEKLRKERIDAIGEQLKIPIVHVDAREKFHKTIIEDLKKKLRIGLTPNPCVRCNPMIKFDILINTLQEFGYDRLATGHYVRATKKADKKIGIYTAKDPDKDQSYFLCYLTQTILQKSLFPLGDIYKSETYSYAKKHGLSFSDQTESQDLCFLGNIRYGEFLEELGSELTKPGEIINEKGEVLGGHRGLAFFTIGQRKGIGVASQYPYYVIRKNIPNNQLVVGFRDEIGFASIIVKDVNWVSGIEPLKKKLGIKIRYRSPVMDCELKRIKDNKYEVKLTKQVKDPAPGQYAVFYIGDEMVGGGEMTEVA